MEWGQNLTRAGWGQNQTRSEQCNPVVAGRQLHHCQAVIRLRPIKDAYRATAGGERNVLHCRHHLFGVQCTSRFGVDTSELVAPAASSEWVACKFIVCERDVQCMQCCPLWVCMQFCPLSKTAWNSSLCQRVCAILPSVKDCVKFFPLSKSLCNSSLCERLREILPLSNIACNSSLCQRVREILPLWKIVWNSPSVKDCVQFFPLSKRSCNSSLSQRLREILPRSKIACNSSLCERGRTILPSLKDYVKFSLCQRLRAILPSSFVRVCVFNSLFVRVDVILPSMQSFACNSSVKEQCMQFWLLCYSVCNFCLLWKISACNYVLCERVVHAIMSSVKEWCIQFRPRG